MRLGLGLGVDSITSQKIGAGFTGILDEYSGAAAAYSVRKLSKTYTGDAIRVRRSSGNGDEQDIGFDANGDLDTTALLAFVNAEHTIADEDFSTDPATNGWVYSTGAFWSADVLPFVNSSSSSAAYKGFGLPDAIGTKIRVSFTVSNYSGSGTIRFIKHGGASFTETGNQGGTPRSANGTYTEELTFTGTATSNANWGFWTSSNFTGEIDDFEVVQITADGFVTKIYNQSGTGGTGRDLAQGTESKQAKIVNAGTLLTEGSKPCIKANIIGTTVYGTYALGTAYEIPQPSFSVFSVLAHGSTQTTYVMSGSTIASDRFLQSSGRLRYTINGSGNYDIYQTIDQTRAIDMYMNDGTLTYHQNNSEIGSIDVSASNGNSFEFKNLGSGGNNNNTEEFQELIIFPEDKDTQRGDIRDNMNTYFSVYS